MTTWREGVEALEAPGAPIAIKRHHWFPWISRTPILITGAAGSGKTEMWRQLTGRFAPDRMSRRPDEGYFFPKAAGEGIHIRKRSLALTTIPGQPSGNRYRDMNWFFGPGAVLEGVIFVATFGFNRVWSNRADSVANQLQPFDIESLSTHNIKQELDSFRATCEKIEEKRVIAEAGICPRWLLVLVNKVDLYWDGRVQAEDYYRPTCKSPFDDVAQQHLPLTDPVLDFQYRVLPVTLKPEQYRFTSNVGEIAIPTQLGSHHAEASLRLLIRSLEDLCGV